MPARPSAKTRSTPSSVRPRLVVWRRRRRARKRGTGPMLLAVKLAEQAARFDAEEGAVVVVGAEGHLVLARAGHLAGIEQVAERLLGDQREAADQLHGVGV